MPNNLDKNTLEWLKLPRHRHECGICVLSKGEVLKCSVATPYHYFARHSQIEQGAAFRVRNHHQENASSLSYTYHSRISDSSQHISSNCSYK
jgi:hypothetical protein